MPDTWRAGRRKGERDEDEEGGVRTTADDVFEATERTLPRIRHAVLAAYPEADDARIASYGKLGVGQNQQENQERLANLAKTVKKPFEAGELALVADIQPDKVDAHAKQHADLNKGKATATTTRQTESKDLVGARKKTRTMLQRVKNWVKSFYGPTDLTAFGFDLPVPATRPRLKGRKGDQGGGEEKGT